MTLDGKFQLMGFYTTRWIEAETAEAAEPIALEMLRDEFRFSEEDQRLAPYAKAYFEEVVEMPLETPRVPNAGASWFPMEEETKRDKSESECKQ
jgi:hypothetical protein